jgi:hypothetical protein
MNPDLASLVIGFCVALVLVGGVILYQRYRNSPLARQGDLE